jgi:glycerol-3-phosphate dehydrogenase
MTGADYDIVVIGGGINGTGIAADAAGRGLKVLLAEMGDLASGTSSASSKLIHGGLRYLEHREFRLVRAALCERELLLAKAAHLIRPLRFVLPHASGGRPRAVIRAGLFLYDHLARRRQLPGSRALALACDPAGRPLRPDLVHGFGYWDCWVDDARLVVANARAAADRGAAVLTRAKVVAAAARTGGWDVTLATADGAQRTLRARALVNAAGPWLEGVAIRSGDGGFGGPSGRLRLVKGSHIVVPRIAGAEDAYILQSPDRRIVFALPFEEAFTLIGTTEVPVSDPSDAVVSAEEEAYLLAIANTYFTARLGRADIVWRFAGVRPLLEDSAGSPAAVTRDYRLDVHCHGGAPVLTVLGGKLTTYRRLAEAALARLAPYLPWMGRPWTEAVPLPGGAFGQRGFDGFLAELVRDRPRLEPQFLRRLARRHGTLTPAVLGGAASLGDMGREIGGGLTEREVAYLKAEEWARTPEDVLWRRTKCGLHIPADRRVAAAETIARLL